MYGYNVKRTDKTISYSRGAATMTTNHVMGYMYGMAKVAVQIWSAVSPGDGDVPRILVLGHGLGYGTRRIIQEFEYDWRGVTPAITAIEISQEMIDEPLAAHNIYAMPSVSLVCADAYDFVIDCDPNSYDIAVVDVFKGDASEDGQPLASSKFLSIESVKALTTIVKHGSVFNLVAGQDIDRLARSGLDNDAYTLISPRIGNVYEPDNNYNKLDLNHGNRSIIVSVSDRFRTIKSCGEGHGGVERGGMVASPNEWPVAYYSHYQRAIIPPIHTGKNMPLCHEYWLRPDIVNKYISGD